MPAQRSSIEITAAGQHWNASDTSPVKPAWRLAGSVVAPALLLQPRRLAQHRVGHAALVGHHALQQGGVRGGHDAHLRQRGGRGREQSANGLHWARRGQHVKEAGCPASKHEISPTTIRTTGAAAAQPAHRKQARVGSVANGNRGDRHALGNL